MSARKQSAKRPTTAKKNVKPTIYDEAKLYPNKLTQNNLLQIYHLVDSCADGRTHHASKNRTAGCSHPYCYQRIGLEKFEKFKKPVKSDDKKCDKKRDVENVPCGLFNNANLCYLNSFLQIWFHCNHFRKFVFNYQSVPRYRVNNPKTGKEIKVQKIMERLQAVFFALELSPYESADAVRLADALQLDNMVQQDVSEFNTLFFGFLDQNLKDHPCYNDFKKIHDRFIIRTIQRLSCKCGRVHDKPHSDHQLHLNAAGSSTLAGMIDHLTTPEMLYGYQCPDCKETDCVSMQTVFTTMPAMLMFQISRATLDQRKDRTPISYPRVLTESTFNESARGHHKYHLYAVCVHDGNAASSGHYHDYIKDYRRDQWFHFNDANVKAVKPLGVDHVGDATKVTADMRGCYLLIYRRDNDVNTEKTELLPPPKAQAIEKRLRANCERLRNNSERSERYWFQRGLASLQTMEKFLAGLKVPSPDLAKKKPSEVVFIPTSMIVDLVTKEYKAVESVHNLVALDDETARAKKLRRLENRDKKQSISSTNSCSPVKINNSRHLQDKYGHIDVLTPEMIAEIELFNHSGSSTSSSPPKRTPIRRGRRSKATSDMSTSSATSTGSGCFIADSSDESDIDTGVSDETEYPELYRPLPPDVYDVPLCIHGKVPLQAVLRGDLKAVRKQGLGTLFHHYSLSTMKKSISKIDGQVSFEEGALPTATDLCAECAHALKKEAQFSQELDEMEPRIHEIINDPDRAVIPGFCDRPSMFLASKKQLMAFKKLAMQQHEYNVAQQHKCSSFLSIATSFPETKPTLSPPKGRKRRQNEHTVSENDSAGSGDSGNIIYKVQTDPASPLKMKLISHVRSSTSAEVALDRRKPKGLNGFVNGHATNHSDLVRHHHHSQTMREESSSRSHTPTSDEEEEPESDEEDDDPDWNGRETPKPKKKTYRAIGSPKKKKSTRQNGRSHENSVTPISANPVVFNHDVTCYHENLKAGSKLLFMTKDEWERTICEFFPLHYTHSGNTSECSECAEVKNQEQAYQQQNREIVNQIANVILPVMKLIEKRRVKTEEVGRVYTHVICAKFVDAFRQAARSRSACVEVPALCQACLICPHDKPYHIPDATPGAPTVLITSSEWRTINNAYAQYFSKAREIPVGHSTSSSNGNVCMDCYFNYVAQEEKKRFEYGNGADVFIQVKEEEGDGSKASWRSMSTRRIAARNLLSFFIPSTSTVKDLKVMVYKRLGVSPNDQLIYNGDDALEDDQTLSESRVEPNNEDRPLKLIVQTRDEDLARDADRGFKDTALAF